MKKEASDQRRRYDAIVSKPVEQSVRQQFAGNVPIYEALKTEVLYSINKKLADTGFKAHSVTARVKTMESFLEKIERKSYEDPFEQSDDLVGARIVCLFLADLEVIDRVIHSIFEVISAEDKIRHGDASTFGYMSKHYVCRLSGSHSGPRYDDVKTVRFELQVRTILMDAWANISHYLSYKNEESIPSDLVKDFHALSGLLYVADRQFESLGRESVRSAARAEDQIIRSGDIQSRAIDADTIGALFRRQYADRKHADPTSISEFVRELPLVGVEDLQQLAQILEDCHEAVLAFEKAHPPGPQGRDMFGDLGMARTALAIYSPKYRLDKYSTKSKLYARFSHLVRKK